MHARLTFPLPGDLPDAGIEPMSLMSPALAGRFFTTSTTWEAQRLNKLTAVPGLPYSSNGKKKKKLPAMQEVSRVQSLGQGDPLEKGMAIHSSILVWRIPYTEKPGGLQFMGRERVRHD